MVVRVKLLLAVVVRVKLLLAVVVVIRDFDFTGIQISGLGPIYIPIKRKSLIYVHICNPDHTTQL